MERTSRDHLNATLALTILGALVVACSDPAIVVAPATPDTKADAGPIDAKRLSELRGIGEGCAVSGRDAAGALRGFAVPRDQLPFSAPAIQRDWNGLGNGQARRIVIERGESRVTLDCLVPNTLTSDQLVATLEESQNGAGWSGMLDRLEHARELPEAAQRGPLSREAQQFESELLAAGSAGRSATSANSPLYNSCEEYMTNRLPGQPQFDCSEECVEWEVMVYFNGDRWRIVVTGYICVSNGGGGSYTWMIENRYMQYCGGLLPDARDHIQDEYRRAEWYTGTWIPDCGDFVTGVSNNYFSWAEMSVHLQHWLYYDPIGVFQSDMVLGTDLIRTEWGGPLRLNSVYRCPEYNHSIGSQALQSRHMYGDAVDIDTDNTSAGWSALYDAARRVPGATVLDGQQDPRCSIACVHVDWRP